MFIPCLEWSSEIPFMLVAGKSPLYVTSSMHWVAEEAQRTLNSIQQNNDAPLNDSTTKDCKDALAASKAVLDSHDEYRSPDAGFADGHSLSMSVYTLRHKSED